MAKTFDLSGFVCPLSKIKATQVLNDLNDGDTATIILGDSDSLKSVAKELKDRGFLPTFKQESDTRYILTVTR
ncbi:MAG: sulfurtransferase TusA family protein [Dehalococcoidales bacterium]|nr:sulfurtransferase TusA family protein [Dehalococcoidales bacterium]